MTNPRWRFARMTPAEINQDPVQGEFFSREANLPGRLVREAIQNSLDARRGADPVRVRFVFSGERDALPADRAARYLRRLRRHVEAVVAAGGMAAGASDGDDEEEERAAYDALACFDRPMDYLVVEDFGTRGLAGDIEANSEREEGNHFWGFFRSIGISPKGENDAGSWGLGKWVFPDASIVNAYLGMTQREGEENWLLMGMALLKTHHLGEGAERRKYRYYGSFAAHDERDDEHWLPLPIDSDDDADDFILTALDDFGLERMENPGLSVIVPYPKDELTPAAIARAVLTQYFLPVVRGDLVVEIVHPDEETRIIDAVGIEEEVGRIALGRDDESPESLRRAIELARWAITREERAHIEIPARNPAGALAGRDDLDTIRERYERGDQLAFRLTTSARARKDNRPLNTSFHLYLERDDDLNWGHDYFMRGPLRIPNMDEIERHKARALVLVDGDSPLGHMLRDAEGPAHEKWSPREQRLKDNWIGGPQRVQDVCHAAERLLQRLTERPPERLTHALAKWFPATTPKDDTNTADNNTGSGTTTKKKPPRLPRSPLEIVSASGGFAVRAPKDAKKSLADTDWTVRFAYDSTGSPSKPFRLFAQGVAAEAPDFSLHDGQLRVEAKGCEYDITGENEFTLHVHADEFRIAVSGFDSRRDVVVDVQPIPEAASESDEDAA